MKATTTKLTVGSLREFSTVGVVAGLAGAYSAVLVGASDIMTVVADHNGGSAGLLLGVVATVFIMIALFVSGVVIAGAVDTVIAGRRKQLQLLRLIGASAAQLRTSLTRGVAAVAAIGATTGVIVGAILTDVTRIILVHNGSLPHGSYTVFPGWAIPAGIAVVITAVAAARVGSRNTLRTDAVVHTGRSRIGRLRSATAILIILVGAGFLALAAVLGELGTMAGFGVAFLGASITSMGILLGARRIVPGLVRAGGRLLGDSAASMVARKNAVSDPARTTRSALSLLIGVTLVTTIASGMSALTDSVNSWQGLTPAQVAETQSILTATTTVLICMIAISVVIASVGFVSTMSLTVIGRTREIGMLRAMGFTATQVRGMIFREALALSGTAVIAGVALGLVFGTVGAQSLVGAATAGIPIGLPWAALASIVVGTFALAIVASLPPSRRAVAVAPVDALAVA